MTLAYMLDTNICISAMRRTSSKLVERLKQHADALCVSTITVHELQHGIRRARNTEDEEFKIGAMLSLLSVLPFDTAAATHSGEIHVQLATQGRVIGAYDMLIAGHARSRGLTVVTNNLREFSRVDQLGCENWLS